MAEVEMGISTQPTASPLHTKTQRHVKHHGSAAAQFDPHVGTELKQSSGQRDVSEHAVLGFAYTALSTVFLTSMGICAKLAGQHGIPVMEIVLARSCALLLFSFLAICWRRQDPRGNRCGMLLVRGFCGFMGISLWFITLLLLPLSDAMVFKFFTPLLVAILSPLFVREVPSSMVLIMMPVCIVGVILAVEPPILFGGAQRLNTWGVAVALAQAFVTGLIKLFIRELRTSESSNVIVFYLGWVSTVGASAACLLLPNQWVWPTTTAQVALLAATGLSAYAYQMWMTLGLKKVRAAPAAAVSYLSVIWGILGGLLIFHEVPDVMSLLGATIICVGTLAVVLQESQFNSRPAAVMMSSQPEEQEKLLDIETAAKSGRSTKQ